ncbi:hypothetical protein [Variovorax rhizosphaerae]|uniref:Hemerythrin-like domain-containing protein n=1 Tax=Variovorax rhizosphaerae TaxID=1836200 RepID=A0ABU8WYJ1_9BURK
MLMPLSVVHANDVLNEAEVEHASAKDLIAQIQEASDLEDKFDAMVTVVTEYVGHHVKLERNEILQGRAPLEAWTSSPCARRRRPARKNCCLNCRAQLPDSDHFQGFHRMTRCVRESMPVC